MSKRVYAVSSVYKTIGTAYVVASSAAEAERIGRAGYEDESRPEFEFSDPYDETKMRAVRSPDEEPSRARFPNGSIHWPVIEE